MVVINGFIERLTPSVIPSRDFYKSCVIRTLRPEEDRLTVVP